MDADAVLSVRLFALAEETPSKSQRARVVAAVAAARTTFLPCDVRAKVWRVLLGPWWGLPLRGAEPPARAGSGTLEESEEILTALCDSVCLRFRVIGSCERVELPSHREVKTLFREWARVHEMDVYSLASDSSSGLSDVLASLCFPSLSILPLDIISYADALCSSGIVSFLGSNSELTLARMKLLAHLLRIHSAELLSHLLALGAHVLKGKNESSVTDATALLAALPFRLAKLAFLGMLPSPAVLPFLDLLIFEAQQAPDPRGSLHVYLILEALLRAYDAFKAAGSSTHLSAVLRDVMANVSDCTQVVRMFDAAKELRATTSLTEAASDEVSELCLRRSGASEDAVDMRDDVLLSSPPKETTDDLFSIGCSDSDDDDHGSDAGLKVDIDEKDVGDVQMIHIFKGIVPGASVNLKRALRNLGDDTFSSTCHVSSPFIQGKHSKATVVLSAARVAVFADSSTSNVSTCLFNAHASLIEKVTTLKSSLSLLRLFFAEGVESPNHRVPAASFVQLEFLNTKDSSAFVTATRQIIALFRMM